MSNKKFITSNKLNHNRKAPCHCGSGKPYELCHLAYDKKVIIHSGEHCPHCNEELIKDISDDWFIKISNSFIKWYNYYKNYDLYKFSSITIGALVELEQKEKHSSLSKNDLFQVYVKYLTQENSIIHLKILEENEIFKSRMIILNDAIEAHYLKKYTLSIPTLFPVIEGVLREIQNLPYTADFKCTLDFSSLEDRGLIMVKDSIFYFNKFITKLFAGKAKPTEFNRNPILHGITADYYSEEHSLILILTVFEVDIIYHWLNNKKLDLSNCF